MFRSRLQPPKRVLVLQILSVSKERSARIQGGKIVQVGLLKNVVKLVAITTPSPSPPVRTSSPPVHMQTLYSLSHLKGLLELIVTARSFIEIRT